MTFSVPYNTPVEVPPGAYVVSDPVYGVHALTSIPPTDGNPVHIVTGNLHALNTITVVADTLGMSCHVTDLPDTDQFKDQKLLTVMTKQDSSYHQMSPGDALVWEDPRMPKRHMHVWTIEGIHIGAPGQESVIALKNASHTNAWDETEIEVMHVPEVLLRGCKLMRAKRVDVKHDTGTGETETTERA